MKKNYLEHKKIWITRIQSLFLPNTSGKPSSIQRQTIEIQKEQSFLHEFSETICPICMQIKAKVQKLIEMGNKPDGS